MNIRKRETIKRILIGAFLTSVSIFSHAVNEKQSINIEHEFNYPANEVWDGIGTFCSIKLWQSLVQDCLVTEKEDGIYRFVTMKDKTVFTERLESYSAKNKTFSYSIKYGPVDLENYMSILKVVPTQGNKSKLIWNVTFESEKESKLKSVLTDLFRNGINGMDELLKNNKMESET
ncbi:SRPBCC family protein [Neptuniibacter sp. QD34_54]|uniref:SRPBCC family protein n=1 Tax=Neptuniibacter sp. QD34_54 TaxID=3398208 RepID=UPI0039F492B2